jgi:hypothetical protein
MATVMGSAQGSAAGNNGQQQGILQQIMAGKPNPQSALGKIQGFGQWLGNQGTPSVAQGATLPGGSMNLQSAAQQGATSANPWSRLFGFFGGGS